MYNIPFTALYQQQRRRPMGAADVSPGMVDDRVDVAPGDRH